MCFKSYAPGTLILKIIPFYTKKNRAAHQKRCPNLPKYHKMLMFPHKLHQALCGLRTGLVSALLRAAMFVTSNPPMHILMCSSPKNGRTPISAAMPWAWLAALRFPISAAIL